MVRFILFVVSAIVLVVMIGIAKRDAGCRRYWTIYACFVVAGFACWLRLRWSARK